MAPSWGETVGCLSAAGGLTGETAQISLAVSGVTTAFLFDVTYGANDATFTALNDAVAGNSTIFLGSDRDDGDLVPQVLRSSLCPRQGNHLGQHVTSDGAIDAGATG